MQEVVHILNYLHAGFSRVKILGSRVHPRCANAHNYLGLTLGR